MCQLCPTRFEMTLEECSLSAGINCKRSTARPKYGYETTELQQWQKRATVADLNLERHPQVSVLEGSVRVGD